VARISIRGLEIREKKGTFEQQNLECISTCPRNARRVTTGKERDEVKELIEGQFGDRDMGSFSGFIGESTSKVHGGRRPAGKFHAKCRKRTIALPSDCLPSKLRKGSKSLNPFIPQDSATTSSCEWNAALAGMGHFSNQRGRGSFNSDFIFAI
jgi:hypothetical protein